MEFPQNFINRDFREHVVFVLIQICASCALPLVLCVLLCLGYYPLCERGCFIRSDRNGLVHYHGCLSRGVNLDEGRNHWHLDKLRERFLLAYACLLVM